MTLELLSLGRSYGVQVVARNHGQLGESWSSDSSQLAYTAGGRVYVWNRADSSRTPRGLGIQPALSPDGEHVAALRGTSLYVDGVQWFRGAIGHPAWSPDGRRVAFAREGGISVASGPGVLDFTAPTRAEPGSPVWSPDGETLAYTDANRVWVARVDGSRAPKAVSPRRANISPLSWSRAGHAIVYTRRGAVEESRVDGPTRVLLPTTGLGAAFDPQQDRVAFAGPRPACPGHVAIRLYFSTPYSTSLTGTCLVLGTRKAEAIEGSPREGDVILRRCGQRPGARERRPHRPGRLRRRAATRSGQTARIGSPTARSSTDRPLGTVGPWLSRPPRSSMRRS